MHHLPVRRSDGEEQIADLVNFLVIAARRATGVALEGGEHEVGRVVTEDGIDAIEVIGVGLGLELAILYGGDPFAAPLAGDLDAIFDVDSLGRFGIDGGGQVVLTSSANGDGNMFYRLGYADL